MIPITVATGAYYVLALADGTFAVTETVESNNVRFAGPIQIGPDLVVSVLTASATAGAGGAITVNDTTRNQGAGVVGVSATSFYLSANLTIDPADTILGSREVSALAGGVAQSASTIFQVPPTLPTGTYYVLAQADGANALTETIETNNTRFSSTVRVGPDLVVSALTVPGTQIPAGTAISVAATTANQGAGAAGASTMTLYLSMNTVLDAADIELGVRSVAAIAAGASESGTMTVTIPPSTAVGSYYVLAQADGEEAVAETSEINNVRLGWIRVGPP